RLRDLDQFGVLLLEQPFAADDLLGHAELARVMSTPICLDESITSPRAAATALRLGACSVINIKPARVGGYLAARAIHDLCAAHGIPVWCGGRLETGEGRAAHPAPAAPPNSTPPAPSPGTSPPPPGISPSTSPGCSFPKTGILPCPAGRAPGLRSSVMFSAGSPFTARSCAEPGHPSEEGVNSVHDPVVIVDHGNDPP